MNREQLVKHLVNRKLAAPVKVGCVPCFGRQLCFAGTHRRALQPKK